jgi:MFS family permease
VSARGLVPRLGRDAWVVLAADLLSAVGTGMTLPFLLVYLHTIRGLSLPTAGAAAASIAIASLAGNPLGGAGSDRIGPRATLAAGLVVAGAGALVLAGVHSPWQAFAGAAGAGLGVSVAWPAQDVLLSRLASQARATVFGVRYATMNLGLAVGALAAALIVAAASASSYVVLYWADGASYLLAIPFLAFLGPRAGRPPEPPAPEPSAHEPPASEPRAAGGYRAVARDRPFRRLWLVTALLTTAGLGAYTAAFPVYATLVAGIRPAMLSLAYAANMITVVVVQLVVLRLLASRRRTSALAALGAIWGFTWGVVLLAGHAGPAFAAPLLVLAAAVFGVGETVLSPTVPAIVNDIAPEQLRGRYNAGSTLAYTTGFLLGPAITGLTVGHGYATALLAGLIAACCLAAVLALRLARWLPASANRPGAAEAAAAGVELAGSAEGPR